MNSIAEQKNLIRQRLRTQRRALGTQLQAQASAAVCSSLVGLEDLRTAKTIAGYRAMPGEVNIDDLLALLFERGATVTVPRVVDNDLEFISWQPQTAERRGAFGIREPSEGKAVSVAVHDVLLTPLVAFDNTGKRLGQGKGFYDRCFASFTQQRPLLIGVAHTFQEVAQVPCDTWDIPLDLVVTDSKVFEFRSRGL